MTGIVLARQLLYYLHEHPDGVIEWSSIVSEPLVVPATIPANELLRTFREAARQILEQGDGLVALGGGPRGLGEVKQRERDRRSVRAL